MKKEYLFFISKNGKKEQIECYVEERDRNKKRFFERELREYILEGVLVSYLLFFCFVIEEKEWREVEEKKESWNKKYSFKYSERQKVCYSYENHMYENDQRVHVSKNL